MYLISPSNNFFFSFLLEGHGIKKCVLSLILPRLSSCFNASYIPDIPNFLVPQIQLIHFYMMLSFSEMSIPHLPNMENSYLSFKKSDQISPALWRLLWYSQADIVAPSSVFPQHLNYHCVMSHCIIIISLQASLPPRLLAFLRPCLMACFIFSTRNNASHKQFFKSRKQAIESAPWRTGSSILSINSLGPRVSGAEVERKESYLCMRH